MKAIVLHTAATDNGGTRQDAGAKLTLGEDSGEIAPERAAALVAAGSAVEVAAGRQRQRVVPDAASDEAE